MYSVALVIVVVVALAHIAGVSGSVRWLKAAYVLVFAFLALRYDYGNDYRGYLEHFEAAEPLEWSLRLEPGWQVLCALFRPLGFFVMVAVLAAFNCWVYYRFMRRYVPQRHYGFAMFLYVCNPYFMLLHASAMRQSLAIAIFLYAIQFIETRSIFRYLGCIVAASTFHASAIFLAPAYLLGASNWKIRRATALGMFAAYVAAIMYAERLKPLIARFITTYAERYEVYEGGTELGTGLGLVFGAAILALILIFARQQDGRRATMFKLAIVSYFATVPLGMINTIAGRMGMYFSPALLAVVPIVASDLRDPRTRGVFLATYAAVTLYVFYAFFQSDVWGGPFGTYRTIFSAPTFY